MGLLLKERGFKPPIFKGKLLVSGRVIVWSKLSGWIGLPCSAFAKRVLGVTPESSKTSKGGYQVPHASWIISYESMETMQLRDHVHDFFTVIQNTYMYISNMFGSDGKPIQVSSQWTYVEIHCDYQTADLYHSSFRARIPSWNVICDTCFLTITTISRSARWRFAAG